MAQIYKKETCRIEDTERKLEYVEQFTTKYEKTAFVMVYLDAMLKVCKGRTFDKEHEVLWHICQQLKFAGDNEPNVIYLLKDTKEKLAKDTGLQVKTIENIISSFKKRGILKGVARGVYELNPYLITKGKPSDIKRIQLEYGDGEITSKITYSKTRGESAYEDDCRY